MYYIHKLNDAFSIRKQSNFILCGNRGRNGGWNRRIRREFRVIPRAFPPRCTQTSPCACQFRVRQFASRPVQEAPGRFGTQFWLRKRTERVGVLLPGLGAHCLHTLPHIGRRASVVSLPMGPNPTNDAGQIFSEPPFEPATRRKFLTENYTLYIGASGALDRARDYLPSI